MGIENQINKETMDKINKIIGKAEENFINRTWRIDIPTSEIVLLNEKGLKDLSNYNAVYAQIFEQISTQFLNNGFCHKNPFVHYSLVHNKAVQVLFEIMSEDATLPFVNVSRNQNGNQ